MVKEYEIHLTKERIETMGDHSLEGELFEIDGFPGPNKEEVELTLKFDQSSIQWRQQNGGPDLYIFPEYTIPCLMESVINLTLRGVKINIKLNFIK
jgi:hypothetical protein